MNTQEKEQLIVGTILTCNEEIKKISKLMPSLNENNLSKNNLYHFNMIQLFQEINPLFENTGNSQIISKIPEESIFVKNTRGNYYAYFQKVYEFLDGYEINLQRTLNESLNVSNDMSQSNSQIDIMSFKNDLKNIILELSKRNDLKNISKEIQKIKILAKKPIIINGFDICNNLSLKKELFERFGLTNQKILAICFDKSNKQLLFVTNTTGSIICYDLETDVLDNYNIVNKDESIPNKSLTIKTYLEILRELINNSLIDIYVNVEEFKFELTDNLYYDNARIKAFEAQKTQTSVIKK